MTDDDHEKWMAEYGPVSVAEWDFDRVPEPELIACCYWEYARESKSISLLADLHWCHLRPITYREEYENDPTLIEEHNERADRIEGWVKDAGFNYSAFMDRYWKTDLPLLEIYRVVTDFVGHEASPWQRLAADVREHVQRKMKESMLLRPLCMAGVGELEQLWLANSTDLLEVRLRVRDEKDDCEECALWAETVPIEPLNNGESANHEKVTAALTVDFSRFTDKEIVESFSAWLKEHRPKEWERPRRVFPGSRQRGKKQVEYRVALDRLGLMRLLHWHSPAQLQAELPDAWKKIRKKEPDFRREIREAAKFFRTLFPFLPEDERPVHEERLGTWMPPMQRSMDEVEREMGLEGGRK